MDGIPPSTRVFYEGLTSWIKASIVLNVVSLIYFPTMALGFRSAPGVSLLMWVFTGFTVLLTARTCMKVVNLYRPMLTLNGESLTYRSIVVPWHMISDLTSIRSARTDYLGVVLSGAGWDYVNSELAKKPLHRLATQLFRKRFEALPIPPAKDAGIEELRVAVDRYRHSFAIAGEFATAAPGVIGVIPADD